MRARRIRFLITFVVAMFLGNNVAVAARAGVAGLDLQNLVVQQLDAIGVGHSSAITGDETSCFAHCVQNYKNPEQKLATNTVEGISIPLLIGSYPSLRIESAPSVIALVPQAIGPPLTILFHNLRN